MFNRPDFEVTDEQRLFECIEQHSFGTLVSPHENSVAVSHLPLLLDRDARCLIGHMARANEHWEHAADQPVVAIFNGPHAYISPQWYQEPNVVPTWNYVAVHVHGKLQVLDDEERRLHILTQYVDYYESGRPNPWSVESQDVTFIERLSLQTAAFEIPIERIEGKWKLGQNHSRERRERVVEALAQSGTDDSREIARLMQASLEAPES